MTVAASDVLPGVPARGSIDPHAASTASPIQRICIVASCFEADASNLRLKSESVFCFDDNVALLYDASVVPQRLDRIELRCLHRREHPEDDADAE